MLDSIKESPKITIDEYAESIIDNIRSTVGSVDIECIDRVAKNIYESSKVSVFGVNALHSIGQYLQSRLILDGKCIDAYLSYQDQLDCANSLDNESVAIIISAEGSYFHRCMDIVTKLKQNDVKIILLTQNVNSKLSYIADEVLICGDRNKNNEGRFSIQYILEILIMRYHSLYGY